MTYFYRKEAVTTYCSASKAKQLYFKQLCFAFKENVFSLQRPLFQESTLSYMATRGHLQHKHSSWTSQSDLGTSLSSVILTGTHSKESDHGYTLRRKKERFLPHNNSRESESFPGCGLCLWLLKSSLGASDGSQVWKSLLVTPAIFWMNYPIN